jgi:hypothetical protein
MFKMQQTPRNGHGSHGNELGLTGEGVAPVVVDAVDTLVEKYVQERNARMELTKREVDAKRALIASLRENVDKIGKQTDGTIIYRHGDLIITLRTGKDELKVRTMEGEQENENDD